MAYEFSFDGKSLWALGGGSAVLCLLLFFAGVLLGANWGSQEPAASAQVQPAPGPQPPAAAQPAVASAAPRPYAAQPPQEPVVYDLPAPRDYAAQGYAPQTEEARGYAAQGYAARAPEPADYAAQQRHAAAPATAAAPAPGAPADAAPPVNLRREAARLNAAGLDADPRLVSEADASPEEAAPQGSASFCVQVGAYAEEGSARQLQGELENKGYTPTVFSGRDAEGRAWYAVRIGAYADQREAAAAASNFSRQERLKATVRPSGSL